MQHRAPIAVAVAVFVAALLPAALAQQFSEWSAPVRLDVGVNSDWAEMNPVLSRDGLSLYFSRGSTPSGGVPPLYTYVAHRPTADAPWDAPQDLPGLDADGPFLSTDGHRLYFHSNRAGGYGGKDLYVSRRHDKNDDFGWSDPENLGPTVNTAADEYFATVFEDEATGETSLYFSRAVGLANDDIYVSKLQQEGTFGQPGPVAELNTERVDRQLRIRRDGLECVFMSNRMGSMLNQQGKPSYDLWFATRTSTSEPWSTPQNMGPGINTGRHEGAPYYSFDGSELYFQAAQRVGNIDPTGEQLGIACPFSSTCYFDLWMVTREKLRGKRRP